ncbi:MAG: hypothetical protein KDA22_14695 [Phycisphaerales bacterium]|nr:hypothetical protein [Phycisphaerales bacterium]
MNRLGRYALASVCIPCAMLAAAAPAAARSVLFNFDNAPPFTPLPIDLTVGGITAHFTATGQGYSVHQANVLGFTPVGFSGLCLYPSAVSASDLLVSYSATLTDFSILYAVNEYNCDPSATMKVTAYMDGALVGFATMVAQEGTWPTATLSFNSAAGFNSVVVHYQSPPPGCDWGPNFMVDNMNVTPMPTPPGDLNGDGHIDGADLGILLSAWGTPGPGDLNQDGAVNGADLGVLLANWTG